MFTMLQYTFMQRAFLAGTMIGIFCPLVGVFLVLRRHALVGDAFAHAALTGIAAGLVLKYQPIYTALLTAILAALGVEYLRRHYRGYAELAIALVLSGSIAVAGILLSLGKPFGGDLHGYLFGSIIAITGTDLLVIAGLGVLIVGAIGHYWRQLFYIAFDEEAARVAGVPVERINLVFILLTAVTVTLAMRVVGTLLVSSLIVVPVAVALQTARSFRETVLVAIATALFTIHFGLVASFYLDVSPGGIIILSGIGLLLLVLGAKGLVSRQVRLWGRKWAEESPIASFHSPAGGRDTG